MVRDTINILGTNVDRLTMAQVESKIWTYLKKDELRMIFTPNSEMIMEAVKDKEFQGILNKGDIVTPDGIGLVYASKILRKPIKERVAGFDIAKTIVSKLPIKNQYSLYLLGGRPGTAETAKKNLERDYPGIKIVGVQDGYFNEDEENQIIMNINNSGADIIFVCLGMVKQEKWIYKNKDKLKAKLCLGVGGTLDVFAGKIKRAPKFFRKTGLEWLYRLLKEPWRFKRMLALPKFAITVIFKGQRQ